MFFIRKQCEERRRNLETMEAKQKMLIVSEDSAENRYFQIQIDRLETCYCRLKYLPTYLRANLRAYLRTYVPK